MSNLTATIDVDLTPAEAKVAALQQKIDQQQQEWATRRREILSQMSDIGSGINLAIQAVRQTARMTGKTLNPIFNALLSLVASTTSLVIGTATLLASSSLGVLTGVAIAISTAAFTWNAIQTAKLIADSEEFKAIMEGVEQQIANMKYAGSL